MGRELGIALRARITWFAAAASALLVGHGFVLAVDVYAAGSRSAIAATLQAREMDPLAGLVRPLLGGLDLAICLFAPLVAARVLSVEKERRTLGALCLLVGGSDGVAARKIGAALAATALWLVVPIGLLTAFAALGGHVDAIETGIALAGETIHLAFVVTLSIACAAWTRTLAQAATLAVAISLTSWAIDAADGFAALAWLGGATAWSIERRLTPFQRGIVEPGAIAWFATAIASAGVLAAVGLRFDLSGVRRATVVVLVALVTGVTLFLVAGSHRGYDWSEQRRASLPPAAALGLRRIRQPLRLDVFLDRDDSRRTQLETDVIAKLYLARPDLVVRTPLDDRTLVAEGQRDADYGRIEVHVGDVTRETRSTSRRELTTLIFEAANMPAPDWSSPSYPGFPFVLEGTRRTLLALLAYLVLPLGLLGTGVLLTQRRVIR